METTVQKTELLAILEENRAKHRQVFEAGIEGYRKEAIRQLDAMIKELRGGHHPQVKIILPMPADHTRDYDRVIGMLKMDIGDTYTLSDYEYGHFVLDDWEWKQQFVTTNSVYAAAEVGKTYGQG